MALKGTNLGRSVWREYPTCHDWILRTKEDIAAAEDGIQKETTLPRWGFNTVDLASKGK